MGVPANFNLALATPVNFNMNRPAKINLILKSLALALGFAVVSVSACPVMTLGDMPLFFEADSSSQFSAFGNNSALSISTAGSQIVLRKSAEETATVQMLLVGANPAAQILGDGEMSGKINYFVGAPAQWRSGVATFSKVRVAEIYPGINLVYYGNQKRLEYDFNIAPGANPDSIQICFDGADKISINSQGELVLKVGDGEIRQPAPVVYQMVADVRKEISGGYKIVNANTIAFAVGNYDHDLPLVIDPILSYSTYFGGTAGETAWAVAVGTNDGSIYITGQTFSQKAFTNGIPVPPFSTNGAFSTTDAFQTNFQGGKIDGDAFVAKFDSSGQNLLYLTYLGGNADEVALGIAVDGSGCAFVTGYTDSTNFPTTTNAIYPKIAGVLNKNVKAYPVDAFVAKLNPGGSNLLYSTYLGGSQADIGNAIAVDSSDNAYVTGYSYSTNFPATNAIQNHLACTYSEFFNANAFVTEIASNGMSLVFSTYLGGTNFDEGKGIALDTSNNIYVAGFTSSTNFPTINSISNSFTSLFGTNSYSYNGHLLNSSSNKLNFASDAFVTKFQPFSTNWIRSLSYSPSNQVYSISNLVYSTYLGGTNDDVANAIAVDGSGAAYVTGWTISTNFPDTVGTNVIVNNLTNNFFITTNVFLTKITNGISAGIDYSVVFGGNASDVGYGVAVDSSGNAFVVGTTASTNFPPLNNLGLLRATNSGGNDVFVTAFNTNASALLYSIYLGGNGNDYGYGIAVDPADNVYVVGQTESTNFPATTLSTNFPIYNAWQPKRNGTNDTFLAIISPVQFQPSLSITPTPTNKVILSWLEPEMSSYKLESNTNLATTNWMTLTNIIVPSNDWQTVTLPSTNNAEFFRLHAF
jgi:hypothetical protein